MYSKCDGGRFHTIKKGDTLYSISRMHNVPLIVLLKANPCLDVYNLQIGDKVCIPMKCDVKGNNIEDDEIKTYAYVIKPGESLKDILDKHKISLSDLLEVNDEEDLLMKPGLSILIPIENEYADKE